MGRLIRSSEFDGENNLIQRIEQLYDKANRLEKQSWVIDGDSYSESYTYNDPTETDASGDGSLATVTTATGDVVSYGYDNLNRTVRETVKNGEDTRFYTAYAYRDIVYETQTTGQVEYRNVRDDDGSLISGFKYAYDAVGNITDIYESQLVGNNTERRILAHYEYDSLNQLTKEILYTYADNNEGMDPSTTTTYEYTYDSAGNILTEKKNGATVNTYSYSTGLWTDQLVAVNGEEITYDGSGNPEIYYSANGIGYDFYWTEGRRLAGVQGWGEVPFRTEYEYDADGIRVAKSTLTITGVSTEHTYVTQNGKVMRETIGSGTTAKVLDFIYDNSGKPFALIYTNGTATPVTYYYVLNLQGDVVKLINGSGATIANYRYNAWGKLLSVTDEDGEAITSASHIANLNPIRYRGYYYDTETGFYYLQSRYYDPANHRFINADDAENSLYASVIMSETNLFAYCANNPVNRCDPSGDSWWGWVAAVAIVVVAAAAVVATAGSAAGAMIAVASVTNGMAAATTASTIAAGAFVGSATALAVTAVSAASDSSSLDEFADHGTAALANTAIGGLVGGIIGYATARQKNQEPKCSTKDGECFIAGTLVKTEAGSKAIEEIEAGDYVWAWDEDTGKTALKRVVETYVNDTNELIHIFANGEEIVTTPSHPFYAPVKGWTAACKLRAGDILVAVNGEYVVVEKIQHELLESPVKVYNFQVEDYHTYFVSNTGILVHNKCNKPTSPGNMQKQVEREQAPANVDQVHHAHVPGAPNQHPHVHFTDGTALNWNGTIHDKGGGTPVLTNSVIEWLRRNNWETTVK